ncbi:TetR/AcrR family transcriptional regulator [Micromonospora sp. R77]|uniref:TetR/AcrR family transcriptional regulator n=1 Tax=Micromonospora sp. R77 TaxID=2925836 RepID=UPI001F608ADB|nr:TetR/AcrR family transcriptional regulator [Micromonospora sp. R77]MCI4061549.1 TetR/AcrR family transcriptional regulator [Micromonospora sp. R77]
MTAPRRPRPAPVPLPGARPGRDPDRAIKRGPRRVSAEVVAATQRDRLFDGLVQEVATRGYDNARVTDICRAAGVTRPAFYALFTGKEDAFLAAYRHGIAVVSQLMENAYREAGPQWPDAARAALRTLLEVLASVPAFARMALVEVDAAGPAARRERDALLTSFRRFFVDAGPVDNAVDRDLLVSTVVGGLYATIRSRVAQGPVEELSQLLPVLTYAATAPFLGRQTASRATHPVRPDGPAATAPCAEPVAGRADAAR